MTVFDFTGLESRKKLPDGDPRGILGFEDYPDELQRLMDARLYADFEHRVKLRDATELERALLAYLGYIAEDETRAIKAHIEWTKGVRAMQFKFLDGTRIGESE
ncbi:hypothetical protein [Gordonia polyisoprenivorans]|uniref:hypothetical protein n=1 Tax=Gordonia polyisoprenivorans TaxID=84595 RepID=UPI001AD66669|nr:hypothetical protein [Gordonia polyisoprenivorans]QTI67651.1 hypothetical protein J6U32_19025 [Gordonia polyisoprenivorans]